MTNINESFEKQNGDKDLQRASRFIEAIEKITSNNKESIQKLEKINKEFEKELNNWDVNIKIFLNEINEIPRKEVA